MPSMTITTLDNIPDVVAGQDIPALIITALNNSAKKLMAGDVVVIVQKIISKSENRWVDLSGITPSPRAAALAKSCEKDPRLVELILRESKSIISTRPGLIIVEHNLGIILANAGIDRSNVSRDDNIVLLLPKDPDSTAQQIRKCLEKHYSAPIGVIITDSVGRPWRLGTTGIAIGAAGIEVLQDLRGKKDLNQYSLKVSENAAGDALAAAAVVLAGETNEGTPVVLIRGYPNTPSEQRAAGLIRPSNQDLFR